ncbi:MAG: FeoB-associated Cys-rich membrane protein [Luteolibacter sp.]
MDTDLQTIIALGIVAFTLAVFLWKAAKPGKKSGCGQSCGCDKKGRDAYP